MKTILWTLMLLAFASGVGANVDRRFHHCTMVSGSGNVPHLFDISEIYACDEGVIEIAGTTRQTIERGYIYSTELGRPSREGPRLATPHDYKFTKWCSTPTSWDPDQKERCGDAPVICWDGKLATWDKDWQGYSCVTPDHSGKR